MDRKKKWLDLAGAALIAAALGTSLAMILCGALGFPVALRQVALTSCALALLCALGRSGKVGLAFSLGLGALLAGYALFSRVQMGEKLVALVRALADLSTGGALAGEYGMAIALVVGGLMTLFMFWLAQMSGGVYPALALSLVLIMGAWLVNNQLEIGYAGVAAAALACLFARASDDRVSYWRAAPIAAVAVLLALLMLPAGNPTWPPLAQAAQKVRDLFDDYFLFTDPRTTYSISADGFQSMGEVLGGPAEPNLGDVMTVETTRPLLLRGSIKRTYTTYSWTESAVNSRYVFIDPLKKQVRDQVFDADRFAGLDPSGAFEQATCNVTMLSSGISALFVPHRLTDMAIPLDLAAYFSTSGEVFLTRGVVPGDRYLATALIPTGDQAAMRALLAQAQKAGDDRYQDALNAYTSLPHGIEQGVYTLAQQITGGITSPYDKALAIEQHLMTHYQYDLTVDYPPRDRDFVSHFLLEGKTGYCSYFASAMAVMARMAGLPSRYVEGYLVPVREGGVTTVTGKNAHAWVEIYFEGAGWIPFNPTPGSGDSYDPDAGSAGKDGGGKTALPPQEDPNQSPDPTAAPTPEPTDAPPEDEPPEDQPPEDEPPEDQPPEDQPPEDQPPEDEPPEDQPPEEQPPEDEPPAIQGLWWLLVLIPIAGAAFFVVKRLRDSDPCRITKGRKSASEKLLIWYRALILVLEAQGQVPGASETPVQFAARLESAAIADAKLSCVMQQLSLSRYAGRKPDANTLGQAQAAYAQLTAQLKPPERLRWLAHRLTQGLGDMTKIP
ncbi:MAG: transglutaminase domain-containing protein [Clostridia bacterium]